MPHLSGPEIALLASGLLCLAFAAVGTVLSLAGLVWFFRRRRASVTARIDALESLGWRRTGPHAWSMSMYGTTVAFEDKSPDWRWTVRLPRYNTLTLQVEERASGIVPEGKVLLSENPALDGRFAMGAERSAQSVALITNRAVGQALLALPWVSMRLRGDELVLQAPATRALAGTTAGTPKGIGAEAMAHRAVVALVIALFDSLYSKDTGTIMPEHR